MINGTAAAAPSALCLMIAGRLRIGLSIALASPSTRQSRGQVSNGLGSVQNSETFLYTTSMILLRKLKNQTKWDLRRS